MTQRRILVFRSSLIMGSLLSLKASSALRTLEDQFLMRQTAFSIGFDAKRAFCNYRGLGTYSRLLIEGLSYWYPQELSMFLFTPDITLKGLEEWPPSISESKSVHRILPKGLNRWFPELWRGLTQVKEWNSIGLDIYHGLSNEIPLGLEKPSSHSRNSTKTIVTIHDLIFIRHPELYPFLDRWNYKRKVTYSCRVADSIIALSEQTKSDLLEFLKVPEEKIKIIYQSVHPRYYKSESKTSQFSKAQWESQIRLQLPSSSKLEEGKNADQNIYGKIMNLERPYFLFVGAFEERKNALRLIRAYAKAREKLLDHALVLIGRGRQMKEIQHQIQSLSLENDIKIFNDISSDQLPSYYQAATAVVYPSLFEGFGLPIVEAMMSETLVLTSRGGCFPEAAGSSAFFVDPYSEEEIAQGLIHLVELSQEERQSRIAQGLEHCKKFHWKNTSEQLVSHYKTL